MSTTLVEDDTPIIPLKESHRFIKDCMVAVGTPSNHAENLAEALVIADYRGHYSHGMNRLGMYILEVQQNVCDTKALPEILKETPATAWVDGHNGLGTVIGKFSMNLAISKAKNIGVGIVVAKGSNHYGIAGIYALQALEEGLIGMSFTNGSPLVAPTRAKKGALGTNPISVAAPGLNGDNFVLDMATSAVAFGKIEMKLRKNLPVPEEWCQDVEEPTLLPLGGRETTSGYKGYGLAVMVEILCGILGGAAFGPNVRKVGEPELANLGQCFIALDPGCFAPGFQGRLSDLMDTLRTMEPAKLSGDENTGPESISTRKLTRKNEMTDWMHDVVTPEKVVQVAGDPEKMHMAAVDRAGGVRYVKNQLQTCIDFAKKLNVKPLKPGI